MTDYRAKNEVWQAADGEVRLYATSFRAWTLNRTRFVAYKKTVTGGFRPMPQSTMPVVWPADVNWPAT